MLGEGRGRTPGRRPDHANADEAHDLRPRCEGEQEDEPDELDDVANKPVALSYVIPCNPDGVVLRKNAWHRLRDEGEWGDEVNACGRLNGRGQRRDRAHVGVCWCLELVRGRGEGG